MYVAPRFVFVFVLVVGAPSWRWWSVETFCSPYRKETEHAHTVSSPCLSKHHTRFMPWRTTSSAFAKDLCSRRLVLRVRAARADYLKSASISSKVLPFVSGTKATTKQMPRAQTPPKMVNVTEGPSAESSEANVSVTMNESVQFVQVACHDGR